MRLTAKAEYAVEARPLTRADLEILRAPRHNMQLVTQLRDSHHRPARLLALGLRLEEVAMRSGYSVARISVLRQSPAFAELVEHYRKLVDERFLEAADEFLSLGMSNMMKAERMIEDKLDAADEAGETLPTRELIAISRDAADRFGYGKHQTNHNINTDFAAELERAIARSKTVEGRSASSTEQASRADRPSPSVTPLIRRRA